MQDAAASARQLKLFHLENPFSTRMGVDFFRALPTTPGVYFFYGKQEELLYIGQSANLKARIGSYRHVSPEKNPKRTLRLVHRIHKIDWRHCATSADAVELERVLLLEHRPPFNRAGVWQGDPWWLKVESLEGALQLSLDREAGGIGPLPSAFRYVYGSLVRAVYRVVFPERRLFDYPHGLTSTQVPRTFVLSLPDPEPPARWVTDYVTGRAALLLGLLANMPPASSAAEGEYWEADMESLNRFAEKLARQGIRESVVTK